MYNNVFNLLIIYSNFNDPIAIYIDVIFNDNNNYIVYVIFYVFLIIVSNIFFFIPIFRNEKEYIFIFPFFYYFHIEIIVL